MAWRGEIYAGQAVPGRPQPSLAVPGGMRGRLSLLPECGRGWAGANPRSAGRARLVGLLLVALSLVPDVGGYVVFSAWLPSDGERYQDYVAAEPCPDRATAEAGETGEDFACAVVGLPAVWIGVPSWVGVPSWIGVPSWVVPIVVVPIVAVTAWQLHKHYLQPTVARGA